jgi:sensor histidine kinase YesM
VLLLQEGISLFESFYGKPLFQSIIMYKYGLLPGVLTTLLLGVTVYKSRTPIRRYLLAGMVSLLFFTFASLLLNVNPVYIIPMPAEVEMIVNYIGVWIVLGVSVEGFCFALALAHRGRLIELENRRMHQQYAGELEAKLTERTEEIAKQNRQLEQQRLQQMEQAFEQRLAETEMGALRAQMNPHFIFNCLNSIKLYATDNDAAKAADYLTKFSRLIRLVLENSRSERVSLQKELQALSLYLEMEAMRFKDKLKFIIDISPDIDMDFIEIPPLLIQPYVENAIWHGLMHKEEGGTVHLRAEQPGDNLLRITISDDGIGRQKAAELKSKSATPRKSFGMEVTSERIALINQLYRTNTQVQIQDLVDASGDPAGTVVVLEIPI